MLDELRRHNAIVQERIMKSFGYADTEDFIQKGEDEIELIQKGEIDYDWELEKAVYADTAQNRRLNRVGQEYHRGRKKKNMDEGNDVGSGNNLGSQASKTDTSTLKKVASSDKAPSALKDAAKKELQNRGKGDKGGNKPESNRQKEVRLRKEVREFLKKTGTKLNTPEFYNKVKEIMERENVDSHIMSQALGGLYKTSGEMADAYGVIRRMASAKSDDGNDVEKKPENRKQKKERIRNEIQEFFKKTGTHNESTEYHKKLKDIMEREHLTMNSIINIAGNFMGASQAMKAMKAIKGMKASESGDGVNKVHEKVKKDTIKDILNNGAGAADDRFIDNNKTDYYKSVMKKYGVSDVGELADKLGEEDGGYEKYDKIYSKMLRQIPASAFHKEYGD